MGEISVSKQFDPDYYSAFSGWAHLHAEAFLASYESPYAAFHKLVKADLIERAKKRAKELQANAIVDLSIDEGTHVWTCSGTAVRVLELAKKES